MSNRSKRLLTLGATGLVLAAGAAAYWYWRLRPGLVGDSDRLLGAAALLPEQALMASYVSTDSPTWDNLEAPAFQALLGKPLVELEAEWSEETGLSYTEDLKPWIDGVMVSLLPPTEIRPEGSLNLLVLVGIGDPLRAKAFADRVRQESNLTVTPSDYKGVEITEIEREGSRLYSANLGRYLAISPERQSIERTIDTSQGATALTDQPEVETALRSALNLDQPLLQFYIPDYGSFINQLLVAAPNAAPLPPETLAQLQQFEGLSAGVGLEENGLRFQAVVRLNDNLEGTSFESSPGQVLENLPDSTLALFSGQNLSSLWQTYVQQASLNPQLGESLNNLRRRFQQFGLEPDQDLFSWMTGEFALGAVPSQGGIMGQLGLGAVLVLESSDRPTTEATLDKLDRLAERSNLQVEDSTAPNGQPLTKWILPQGIFQNEVLLGYGWLDGDSLFLGLGSATVETMIDTSRPSLDENPTFQAAVQALPQQNAGYFYVNVSDSEQQLRQSPILGSLGLGGLGTGALGTGPLGQLPAQTEVALGSLQSIAMTTSQRDAKTSQVDLFIAVEATPAAAPEVTPEATPEATPEGE